MKKRLFISTILLYYLIPSVHADDYYTHGFTIGYAKTNFSNDINLSPKGINFKYHLQTSDNDIGLITSFSYTRDSNRYYNLHYNANYHNKINYLSLSTGPSYTFNNVFRIYGLIGFGRASINSSAYNDATSVNSHARRTDLAYGGGMQFKIKNLLLDFSIDHVDYNKSVGKVRSDNFSFTIGWEF